METRSSSISMCEQEERERSAYGGDRVYARIGGVLMVLIALLGCSKLTPPTDGKATFVNRVWRVSESSSVAPGQLYVFLSEGTLVVASPKGTPSLGTWSNDGGSLMIVEENLPYKVDILELSENEFRIRINNPGEPVVISLVPAQEFPGPHRQ